MVERIGAKVTMESFEKGGTVSHGKVVISIVSTTGGTTFGEWRAAGVFLVKRLDFGFLAYICEGYET